MASQDKIVERLNQISPEFRRTGLSKTIGQAFNAINELSASFKSLTAQLDADTGVNETTYAVDNDPKFADIDADENLKGA